MSEADPAGVAQHAASPFFGRLPRALWVAALLIVAFRMLPYLHAALTTPPDWSFTGTLTVSPDYMQYRVWMRQALVEGPIVSNRFTTEPSKPYLPVPFYWAVAHTAQIFHVSPDWALVWIGAAFAFLLTILIFACARYFLRSPVAIWTAFIAIMLGGGVGGYINYLRRAPWAWNVPPIRMLLIDPFRQYVELIDNLRGDYVVSTLFDTHFLLIWILCVSAIMLFYATIKSFTPLRLAAAAALFALATVIHVYEGVTLIMIVGGVALLCWIKDINKRQALLSAAVCTFAVGLVFIWIVWLVHNGGLPVPPWRGVALHPSLLFLAFPVAWVVLVAGLVRYWHAATLDQCFLLGWLLGCTALSLSAPFYPWPNRGVLSMQIPLTIIAAAIWFARHSRLTWRAAVIAILLMGSTPAMQLYGRWHNSAFNPKQPQNFLSPEHRALLRALSQRAGSRDVLLAEAPDRLWLAPDYPGHQYAGHFFLTVRYDRKQAQVDEFYEATPEQQREFLSQKGIRFVYVTHRRDPARFLTVPGLTPIHQTAAGTLFEYSSPSGHTTE